MAKTKTAGKKKQSKSFILTLGLILLVGYFVITIIGHFIEIKESNAELEQQQQILEQQLAENAYLKEVVDSDDKSEYIEQVAREQLGFGLPNEKVFYDVTPGA
jgi:cell division protein FtsB